MPLLGFRRETLVDASVNLVPFAILACFVGLFLAVDPWTPSLGSVVIAQALLLIPAALLLAATGVIARQIQRDEDSR